MSVKSGQDQLPEVILQVDAQVRFSWIMLSSTVNNRVEADALNALISLGIARQMAEQAIKKALSATPEILPLEELLKRALKNV